MPSTPVNQPKPVTPEVNDLMAELEEARETLRALKYGQVDALIVTGSDNEERVFALLGSDKIAQSIFEQSAEAIVVCDITGTVIRASEAAHEICGANPLLQPFSHVFPLRLPSAGANAGQKYFQIDEVLAGAVYKGLFVEYSCADGRQRLINVSASPLRDAKQEVHGCVIILLDVTAHKTAENELKAAIEREREARNQLQASLQIREEFLGVISHELRTPLMSILGWAQLLEKAVSPSPEQIKTGLRTIERNARIQVRIIEDMLDLSRIVTGKLRLDIDKVNAARVVGDVLDTMRPAAEAKNIELHFEPCDPAIVINADAQRVQQVIWNMVANAIKFTPKDGRVNVAVVVGEAFLEIIVSDTGAGIDPAFLPHVFDRFRQADSSTTRQNHGIGLGLAIVRHIVELHQGTVSAQSDGLGKGSVFKVRLPVPQQNRNAARS